MRKRKTEKLGQKYLRAFFLVVLSIDLLVTITFYLLYSRVQISKTRDYSISQLEQVCVATDILYESLQAVVNQVRTDTDTVTFFCSSQMNRLQEARVGGKIRSICTANPYLRYITLYNSATNRFVSSAYAGYSDEMDIQTLYEHLDYLPYVCFYRPIGAEFNVQQNKTAMVYTFIFRIVLTGNNSQDLVVLDVQDSYFNKALAPIRTLGKHQEIVIKDAQGNTISSVVAAHDQNGFTVLSEQSEPEILTAHTTTALSGSFSGWENNIHKFVTYANAPGTDWTIYNILPYGTVLAGLGSLTVITTTLTVGTLAFGYFISRRVSSSLYTPIKNLYESYVSSDAQEKKADELELLSNTFSEIYSKADQLEQGLISSFQQSKNMYLNYLLFGEEEKVRSVLPVYEQLKIDLNSPYYAVILIECVPQSNQEDIFLGYFALENITRELLTIDRTIEFICVAESKFVVLTPLQNPKISEKTHQNLETIATVMNQKFGIDTTICISNITDSWTNINLIYEQACIAINSRSANHYGHVFFFNETPEAMNYDLYYSDMHSRLSEYVRTENVNACAEEFNQALATLNHVPFKTAKTYFRHTLMSVMDDFSISFKRNSEDFIRLMDQLDSIDRCQNVQNLRAVFTCFLKDLCSHLSYDRKNLNHDTVLRAKDYIDQNYANPDLSLNMLAEKFNFSPAYLGKLFTLITTYTFKDYLTKVRTSKAAELLCTTDRPISKISEEVGILNINYFYSVFKKCYGVTPSAYRKKAST